MVFEGLLFWLLEPDCEELLGLDCEELLEPDCEGLPGLDCGELLEPDCEELLGFDCEGLPGLAGDEGILALGLDGIELDGLGMFGMFSKGERRGSTLMSTLPLGLCPLVF